LASGKYITAMGLDGCVGQALIDAKQSGRDSCVAIKAVISWDAFAEQVIEGWLALIPALSHTLLKDGEINLCLRS